MLTLSPLVTVSTLKTNANIMTEITEMHYHRCCLCPPGDAVCTRPERQEAVEDVDTATGEELHHAADAVRRGLASSPARRLLPAESGRSGGVRQGRLTTALRHRRAVSRGLSSPPRLRHSIHAFPHGTSLSDTSGR